MSNLDCIPGDFGSMSFTTNMYAGCMVMVEGYPAERGKTVYLEGYAGTCSTSDILMGTRLGTL